jgi:hypothetical protein
VDVVRTAMILRKLGSAADKLPYIGVA